MALAVLLARRRRSGPVIAWWPVVLPLALMVSSDYKLRSRPPDETLGGRPDATVLIEIMVYGLVVLFCYRRFGLRPPIRRTSGLLLAAWAWSGYLAFTVVWSPFIKTGTVRAAQLLVTVMVGHLLATRASPADLRRLAHAFVALVLCSVGIGVVHPLPRTALTQDRFNWLYVHPVTAGVYLGVAVLLVVAFLLHPAEQAPEYGWRGRLANWPPFVYFGSLVILAGALIATGTRGAALGAVVGILIMLATSRGPKGRADLLVMGVAGTAILVLAFADRIHSFVTRGENEQALLSLNSRTDLWSLAMRRFGEEPIFGWGLGASRGLFLRDIGLGGGHNAFINAMVDAGSVGVVMFTVLLVTLAVVSVAMTRRVALRATAGLLLGLLGFFVVDGMTMEGLAAPANVSCIWLFVMVGWAESLRRRAARSDGGRSLAPVGGTAPQVEDHADQADHAQPRQ